MLSWPLSKVCAIVFIHTLTHSPCPFSLVVVLPESVGRLVSCWLLLLFSGLFLWSSKPFFLLHLLK